MKVLLRKDLYLLRTALPLALLAVVVIGAGMSAMVSPNIFLIMTPVVLGIIESNSLNTDKKCGWPRLAVSLPAGLGRVIGAKYLLYLLLSLAGVAIGAVAAVVLSTLLNAWDIETFHIFLVIGLSFPLVSGAVALPATYLWEEDKNMVATILTYPLSSMVFISLALGIGQILVVEVIFLLLGAAAFAGSWVWAARTLPRRDLP